MQINLRGFVSVQKNKIYTGELILYIIKLCNLQLKVKII